MADTLQLSQAIFDKAKELFKDVYDGKHYKGHSTHSIASSCLYIASRWETINY
jgi:transcription initiation factor TFIIIB Brf1 subunit/transcription initiation factor TFIIB